MRYLFLLASLLKFLISAFSHATNTRFNTGEAAVDERLYLSNARKVLLVYHAASFDYVHLLADDNIISNVNAKAPFSDCS